MKAKLIVGLFLAVMASQAGATVLYQTNFDNNSGATPGDAIGGLTVDGLTWTQGGSESGTWYVGNNGENTNPFSANGFGSSSVGCLYGSYQTIGSYDIWPQVEFNTNSSVGNETVRAEFYIMPGIGGGSNGYLEAGLWQLGTTNRQATLFFHEGTGEVRIRNNDGSVAATGVSFTDNVWYHAALEVDYVANTAKLYLKQVASGDTSPLTEADLLTFGGSATFAITPGSTAYATTFGMHTYKNYMTGAIDNLTIIPEPGTMLLLTLGGGVLALRRRK